MWFAAFFRGRKALSVKATDLKIVARWRYDTCRNAQEKFFKNEKMGAKFVRTTSTIQKRAEYLYHSLLPHVL